MEQANRLPAAQEESLAVARSLPNPLSPRDFCGRSSGSVLKSVEFSHCLALALKEFAVPA